MSTVMPAIPTLAAALALGAGVAVASALAAPAPSPPATSVLHTLPHGSRLRFAPPAPIATPRPTTSPTADPAAFATSLASPVNPTDPAAPDAPADDLWSRLLQPDPAAAATGAPLSSALAPATLALAPPDRDTSGLGFGTPGWALADAARHPSAFLPGDTGPNPFASPLARSSRGVRWVVARATELRDGGVEQDRGASPPTADDALPANQAAAPTIAVPGTDLLRFDGDPAEYLPGFFDDADRFDVVDVQLAWPALRTESFQLDVLPGLRAVRADVSRLEGIGDEARLREEQDLQPLPILGTDLTWHLTDAVALTGAAATQTVGGGSLLDLQARAEISLSENIFLKTGYRFIDTRIEVDEIDANLRQEGVFARFEIRF